MVRCESCARQHILLTRNQRCTYLKFTKGRYAEVLSHASFNVKCNVDMSLSSGSTTLQGIAEHMTNELTEKTYVLSDCNIVTDGRTVPLRGNVVPASPWPVGSTTQNHHEVRRRYLPRLILKVMLASGTICSKTFMNTTKFLTLCHPSRRSRRLLRFGMDWRINRFSPHRCLSFTVAQ